MRTNELIYDFKEDIFWERYSVFCVQGKEMWKNPVVDLLKHCGGAEAVAYSSGNCCHVLVSRELEEDFQEQVLKYTDCTIELEEDISPRLAAQLFLNSLTVEKPEKVWNMTGKCYIPHMEKATEYSFPAIDIHIDRENRIQLDVRTFSDFKTLLEYYKKKDPKRAAKICRCTRYKKTLFGLERAEDGNYILCHDTEALDEKKSSITFLSVREADYECTKLYDLYYVLAEMSRKYSDIIQVSFREFPSAGVIKRRSREQVAEASLISKILMETPINLVNKTEDEESFGKLQECLSDQIKNMIKKEPKSKPKKRAKEVCHLPVICSDSLQEGAFNLCMIHEKDFYRNMEDAHTVSAKVPLQHITVETIQGCRDAKALLPAVTKCIYDVIIKSDIQKKQLSLFDWKKLGIQVPVEFWMKTIGKGNEEVYGSVSINPEGTLQFSVTKNAAEPAVQYLQMDKSYKAVIKRGNDYNIIQDTVLFTVPDLEGIHRQMETVLPKKSISRSRENIEAVIPDIVDIRTWMEKDGLYYIVGSNSYGTDGKFLRATPVRKVSVRPGSELFFLELLPTLAMPFVRNKQYTVYPFPLKYIREYCLDIDIITE